MFSTSNIFGKKKDESNKLEVAKELVHAVLDIVGPQGFKDQGALAIYSKYSNEEPNAITARFYKKSLLAALVFKFNEEETGFAKVALFLNYDKIMYHVTRGDERARFEDLMLEHTNTKLFVFVLLHELGHYWQKQNLISIGKISSYIELSRHSKELSQVPGEGVELLLSVDELAADLFASQKIHGVLAKLYQKNPSYLTCLD